MCMNFFSYNIWQVINDIWNLKPYTIFGTKVPELKKVKFFSVTGIICVDLIIPLKKVGEITWDITVFEFIKEFCTL